MNKRRRNVLTFLATRPGISGFVIVALMALMVPQAGASSPGTNRQNDESNNSFKHVFIIMMENTGFATLIGNPNAPWINAAAQKYGLATNYFGVTHPSQPNYIAATSGSTNGVVNDNDTTINVSNIVDQLEAHGKSWKAYMQSFSLCATPLDHACGNQLYERKHNPFISYQDVQGSPARVAKIVDFEQFQENLDENTVPDYSWISPDQCHDMHGRAGPSSNPGSDPCDFSHVQGLIATGDAFLSKTVHEIMHSRAWTGNSAIFISWDESDFTGTGPSGFGDTSGCCDAVPGGGHVLTIVISHKQDEHVVSNINYNHYSMLDTIEDSWNLGCLGFACDTTNVPDMRALVED